MKQIAEKHSFALKKSLIPMSAIYIVAGILHFLFPPKYLSIMPPWLPAPLFLVYLSGFWEIISGSLLLFYKTKRIGAWLIIILLIGVFPANIQMSINYYHAGNPYLWATILRLPIQFLLIYWAWKVARPRKKIM